MQRERLKRRKRAINVNDIVNRYNVLYKRNLGDKAFIEAVINRYTEIAQQTLLNGYEWQMPVMAKPGFKRVQVDTLKLCIYKSITKRVFVDPSTGEKQFNLRRPNERNELKLDCQSVRNKRYRFVASAEFKKKLKDILENTYKQYRLE